MSETITQRRKAAAAKRKANPPGKGMTAQGLAQPGDPFVMLDGETIQPVNPPRIVDLRKEIDPATFRPDKKRNANELPATPKVMWAVSVVFVFTMLGLGDREIADILKTSVIEVETLRKHIAYTETFETILNTFISSNSSMLKSRIAAYSHDALSQMAHLSSNGKQERTVFEASRDLLDRAGVSPKEASLAAIARVPGLKIIMIEGDLKTAIDPEILDDDAP